MIPFWAPPRWRWAILCSVVAAMLVPAQAVARPAGPEPAAGIVPHPPAAQMATVPGKIRYTARQVLVGFQPGVSSAEQRVLEQRISATPEHPLDRILASNPAERALRRRFGASYALRVPAGTVQSAIRELRREGRWIRYAEPDYLLQASGAGPASTVPNDPSFNVQWGSLNTGQTVNGVSGTAGADDSVTKAWSVSTGSRSIVVGEPDTGVDYTHPDLAPNIWTNPGGIGNCPAGTHGYNVIDSTCDPMDTDTSYGGHGTHVAGIIGAVGDNGSGVAGMNWSTTILPVRWLGDENTTGDTTQLISALNWLLGAKQSGVDIRVINDSSVYYGTAFSQALSDEIDELGAAGILFVTAAGNSGQNMDANSQWVRYPCAYDRPTEICVTASDQNDALWSQANYAPDMVDLAAPGVNIYSTLIGGAYGYISGGSMATAQVSGAAALILSVQDMSPTALKADILDNVDKLASLSGKVRTGGRLDVCAAMPGCAAPIADQSAVACSPASVDVGQATTCTVTVSDTASGMELAPTGIVSLSSNATGSFAPQASCSLSSSGSVGAASCSVSYTPAAVGSGPHTLSAVYGGDSSHGSSSGSGQLSVASRTVQTKMSCTPGSVVVGQASTCTATVSDTSAGTAATPAGSVAFSSDSSGTFSQSGSCSLTPSGTAGSAACSLTYTPAAIGSGTHDVTAGYQGDGTHGSSFAIASIRVAPAPQTGGTGGGGGQTGQNPRPRAGVLAPVNVSPPSVFGTPLPGDVLSCSPGGWLHSPQSFRYRWTRNGAGIAGADTPRWKVGIADESSRLQCMVTAINGAGAATAAASGSGELVALRDGLRCPAPSGRLNRARLGRLALGMRQARARQILPHLRETARLADDFCLYGGWGIQIEYAQTRQAARPGTDTPARLVRQTALAMTDNPHYSALGLHPGMRVGPLRRRPRLRNPLRFAGDQWYIVPGRAADMVLEVRGGIVQAVGVASRSMTQTRGAQRMLLQRAAQAARAETAHRQPGPAVIWPRRRR